VESSHSLITYERRR